MSVLRDPNAIIGAWLEDGPNDLPDPTRRAIVTSLRTTQQRRGLGLPWRLPQMNGSLRPLLIAVALALAVGGIYLFSGGSNPSVPLPNSPAPTTVASASPVPSASAPPIALTGRITYTRYDTMTSQYGPWLGVFTANADGTGERRLDIPSDSDGSVFSPDGTKILLTNQFSGGKWRPAVVAADGSGYQRLDTPGSFQDFYCNAWSPDGTRLLCASQPKTGQIGIYSIRASDGGDLRLVVGGGTPGVKGSISECGGGDTPGGWSPDGTQITFIRHHCGTGDDPVGGEAATVFVANADGTNLHQVAQLGTVNSSEGAPRWSPDGQWIAYGTAENRIAIVHPDGSGYQDVTFDPRLPVGYGFAYSPTWSPDGSAIMFTLYANKLEVSNLYVIRPDSSGLAAVTSAAGTEDMVSWTGTGR